MNQRLLPMLAVASAPFDSAEYLFEVKWDGVRALAAGGPGGWSVWGRDVADYSARYPELAVLGRFPAGTVLDGELVRWGPDGLSNLGAILKRHHLTNPARIEQASRSQPVCYVVFDLLHLRGRSLLGEPLQRRREALQELLQRLRERYVRPLRQCRPQHPLRRRRDRLPALAAPRRRRRLRGRARDRDGRRE